MTCNEIESRLPAYLEHLLSPEEKETIEGHFASCPRCSRVCEDIRKTQGLVQDLPEVEPPPFFEQRIMSGVREEAAQKQGILRKLFYPLYIKIPIQAFATLLVAVMAFSIYRTVMPELKDLAPPAITVPEPAKDQTTAESLKAQAAPAAVTPVMKAPARGLHDEKKQGFAAPPVEHGAKADRMAGSSSPPPEERAPGAKSAVPIIATRGKENLPLRAEAVRRIQDRAVKQEAAQSFEAPLPEPAGKGKMAAMGAAPAPSQAMDAAIQRPAVHLTIHVKNVLVAVREIEGRLGQVNGRVIERQRRDARELVKAEVAVQNLAAFLHGIEAIGRIKVEKSPRDLSNGTVVVNIQITGEP
jgi:hypothetical protein